VLLIPCDVSHGITDECPEGTLQIQQPEDSAAGATRPPTQTREVIRQLTARLKARYSHLLRRD
jgi:hypothetical protein